MSNYHLCCQHRGKVVQIYEKSGKVHYGKIVEVDTEYVYLDTRVGGPRGFGYGYYGGFGGYGGYGYGGYGYPGFGYRNPYWIPVSLAAIGGLALGAAFFW